MENNTHYFYVLYCQDHSLYAGYTNNLTKRLQTHNDGKGAKYTRASHRRPVHLLYAEAWPTKEAAMQAEWRFKQLQRPAKEAYLKREGVAQVTATGVFILNQKNLDGEGQDAKTE
ncbi:GIY-YIG nuclease family protein [Fundicoccus culcitae]|uniref:GIY-YIG nuclease family protein n=1 Tax=Fundicoccus culcitae TaxID=2969821 RepID=A0ABY5P336_9LACT|nr:GIY-YIG nuclease family protein [Fundicoccus culcitae]UUX33146.1 GIY-YIG nuclease family protein [Fundicoccus culcitae]